jgi:hypothetical protein
MIVVARFNENLEWLKSIKYPFTVYNKGDEIDIPSIRLENIGRESHTYITHIINNYDNLDDWTCFLQGNPEYHSNFFISGDNYYSFNKGDNLNNLNCVWKKNDTNKHLDFFNLIPEKIEGIYFISHYISFCDRKGYPEHPNLDIDKFLNEFFPEKKDNIIRFSVGAQFIVPKKLILKHSKEFYIKIYNYIINNYESPWVLERVWDLIFN